MYVCMYVPYVGKDVEQMFMVYGPCEPYYQIFVKLLYL